MLSPFMGHSTVLKCQAPTKLSTAQSSAAQDGWLKGFAGGLTCFSKGEPRNVPARWAIWVFCTAELWHVGQLIVMETFEQPCMAAILGHQSTTARPSVLHPRRKIALSDNRVIIESALAHDLRQWRAPWLSGTNRDKWKLPDELAPGNQ